MLDLLAAHIIELAFSKHVDNHLDYPGSQFIQLWCCNLQSVSTRCYFELFRGGRLIVSRIWGKVKFSKGKTQSSVLLLSATYSSFKESPDLPSLVGKMNGIAALVRKEVKLSEESQTFETPNTLQPFATVDSSAGLQWSLRNSAPPALYCQLFSTTFHSFKVWL